MNLKDAKALKDSILNDYYRDVVGIKRGLRAQSAAPIDRAERRIAVGLSRIEKSYRVEVRIQRRGGAAEALTNHLAERYGEGVHVAVLRKLEIPPQVAIDKLSKAALEATKRSNSIDPTRPIHIGLSVGHADGGPGTLGALVEIKGQGDGVLSNAHVLAPVEDAKKKDAIFQPGRESMTLTNDDRIGGLWNFTRLSRKGANAIDAAVAVLDDGIEHHANVVPAHLKAACAGKPIHGVGSALQLELGTVLAKVGRTTGYTEATLTAAAVDDVTVLYHGVGNLRFDNVMEITWKDIKHPFTLPGDSGSLVFDPNTMKAVGLHFAAGVLMEGNKEIGVSYACDIGTALDRMKSTLL